MEACSRHENDNEKNLKRMWFSKPTRSRTVWLLILMCCLQSTLYLRNINTSEILSQKPLLEVSSNLIETGAGDNLSFDSPFILVPKKTNIFKQQSESNSINKEGMGILSPENPYRVTSKAIPSLSIKTLQVSNSNDAETEGTMFSNDHLIISTKTSSLVHRNVPQFNASYTCHNGNQTVVLPTFPHFIIAGAQKAATTAISKIISEVPNILRTVKPEGHVWDSIKNAETWTSDQRCQFLQFYFREWDADLVKTNTILYEKTPRLIALNHTPKLINLLLPRKPKIIVILRNPIDRMYSMFAMDYRRYEKNRVVSFEAYMKRGIKYLIKKEALQVPSYSNEKEWHQEDFQVGKPLKNYANVLANGLARGFYAKQIESYMEFFPINVSLKVICYEHFVRNKMEVLQDLVEFIGGPSSFKFEQKRFDEDLGPGSKGKKRKQKQILVPPMTNRTNIYLKHLYKPFNDELADLLGESWRGVWD